MDSIQNNGMSNYAMTVPQQQNDMQVPQDDYSSMPMVYDPTMDEKKESASSGLALKALGAIAIAGLAMYGGHYFGKSSGAKIAKEAEEAAKKAVDEAATKAAEAVGRADRLQKANDAAYEIAEKGHKKGWWYGKTALREDIKKALRPNEAEAKKVEETAANAAKETKGKAEEAAKDAADDVAESAK